MKIPRKIFQTQKSLEYVLQKKSLSDAMNSWKKHRNFEYFFYDDDACENFIQKELPWVYPAYQKLPLAVMKADLWRYCVIYHFGGVYADMDAECRSSPEYWIRPHVQLICGIENNFHISNWTFSAPKGSEILKKIIHLSVERILSTESFKGDHIIHYLTGPGVFTDGIEKYLVEKNLPTFSNRCDYSNIYRGGGVARILVYHYTLFHSIVKHYFTGQDEDGWCKQRDRLLLEKK